MAAWELVRADRALRLLSVAAALCTIAGVVIIFALGELIGGGHSMGAGVALAALLLSYPLTFTSVFINTAIAAAAAAALDGRRLTVAQALAVPAKRLGHVAGWALIATVVGVVLEQIASRLPLGGSIATRLVGLAWSLASLFAIPVLALEDRSPTQCLRRSAELVKERWGEGLAGSVIVTAWAAVALLVLGVAVAVGVAATAAAPIALAAVACAGAVGLTALVGLQIVVRQTFAVALYRYATEGSVAGPFEERDLRAPFSPRRGRAR
jgi:hypothetical protein